MSYTKTNWVNDTEPAINADNLNKMEQGIKDANDMLDGTQVTGNMVVESIKTKNILDTKKFIPSTANVSILDNKNGTLEIQSTSGNYAHAIQTITLTANATYTISYTGLAEQTGSAVWCAIKNLADTETIASETGEGNKSITFTPTENGVIIKFMVTSDTNTGKTKYTNIQLEEGSTATAYKDYQALNGYDIATHQLDGLMSYIDKGSLDSIFGVPVDTVTNLNNVYEGAYKFNTNTTNAPTTISGKVWAFKLTTDNYRYQIVINDYTLKIYARYRYYYNSQWIWSSWYSFVMNNDTTFQQQTNWTLNNTYCGSNPGYTFVYKNSTMCIVSINFQITTAPPREAVFMSNLPTPRQRFVFSGLVGATPVRLYVHTDGKLYTDSSNVPTGWLSANLTYPL